VKVFGEREPARFLELGSRGRHDLLEQLASSRGLEIGELVQ